MFDTDVAADGRAAVTPEVSPPAGGCGHAGALAALADTTGRALRAVDITRVRESLVGLDVEAGDAELVDQLRALEELKAAACAAQAQVAVALDVSQRAAQARAGVPAERRGQGVGAQVALARKESPARGGRLLGLAKALVLEMPHTYAALQAGLISEWRATLLVRESACLSVADRAAFDRDVAADPVALEGLGDKRLVALARKVAYRLDPHAIVERARRAPRERCVTLRPAPDAMTYLTALLPMAQGVGVLAALTREADAARAVGDERSRGQVMADTLVERLTGRAHADEVPVELQVVMTDRSLLAGDGEPAHVPGYGTVPAQWARDLVAARLAGATGGDVDGRVAVWVRRLFTAPESGQLVAMDSRRRIVPAGLAAFVGARDQTCRTPWCDAPIRHRDHIVPAARGGATSADNLQGTCEACNYTKQAPGWRAHPVTDDDGAPPRSGHVVETTTPTGHRYRSRAPALPGHQAPGGPRAAPLTPGQGGDSALECCLIDVLRAA